MSTHLPARMTMTAHAQALLRLAVPLALSSLSQMAMGLTDSVLLGGLGGDALAAGGLAASLFFTVLVILQGALIAAGVLAAQALGAGDDRRVASLYGTGLVVGSVLSLIAFAGFSLVKPALLLLHEPPVLANDVGLYMDVLRWGCPASLACLGMLRAILPAIDEAGLLLWVMPPMVVVNGLLNYGLIHGFDLSGWHLLPALGLRGSALATTLTLWLTVAILFVLLHRSPAGRRLVTPPRFVWAEIGRIVRIGIPISVTIAAETLLFLVAGLAAGRLGESALTAHQVVLSITAFIFMVPLSLGQATNVRVGLAFGAGDLSEARRAGLAAIGVVVLVMTTIGITLLLVPHTLASLFLDPHIEANQQPIRIVVALLGIAALFQVVDGVQVVALGALRGMGDTTVPMVLATIGYWAVGAPLGGWTAFRLGLGAAGLWTGLAVALGAVALMMTLRFLARTRTRS